MSAKTLRCSRCQRRCRNPHGWNVILKSGVITGLLCPDCQTPMENAEAEINLATLDYGVSDDGRHVAWPKQGGSR